jgi:hypothetical protein
MYRRNEKDPVTSVPLQEWIAAAVVGDEMLWKGAWGSQLQFIRDTLAYAFGHGLHWTECKDIATVISTHRSKSIELPVVKMHRGDLGLTMVFRNNFHDWKVSVISEIPVNADYEGLCHTTPPIDKSYTGDELSSVYFEGFPKEFIFSYYKPSNRKRYSASVGGTHALWAFVRETLKGRHAIVPYEWYDRETHLRRLEEDRVKSDAWSKREDEKEKAKKETT